MKVEDKPRYLSKSACNRCGDKERFNHNDKCCTCYIARRRRIREQEKSPETRARKKAYLQTPRGKELRRKVRAKTYQNNKDVARKWKRKYSKDPKNLAKILQWTTFRSTRIKDATPPWVKDDISEQVVNIYRERDSLNKEAGYVKYHVDHIVPLVNKKVCGLHVPSNLRVIEASENASKSNKWITSTEPSWPNIPQLKLIQ